MASPTNSSPQVLSAYQSPADVPENSNSPGYLRGALLIVIMLLFMGIIINPGHHLPW